MFENGFLQAIYEAAFGEPWNSSGKQNIVQGRKFLKDLRRSDQRFTHLDNYIFSNFYENKWKLKDPRELHIIHNFVGYLQWVLANEKNHPDVDREKCEAIIHQIPKSGADFGADFKAYMLKSNPRWRPPGQEIPTSPARIKKDSKDSASKLLEAFDFSAMEITAMQKWAKDLWTFIQAKEILEQDASDILRKLNGLEDQRLKDFRRNVHSLIDRVQLHRGRAVPASAFSKFGFSAKESRTIKRKAFIVWDYLHAKNRLNSHASVLGRIEAAKGDPKQYLPIRQAILALAG
jgi:hypothetical protein